MSEDFTIDENVRKLVQSQIESGIQSTLQSLLVEPTPSSSQQVNVLQTTNMPVPKTKVKTPKKATTQRSNIGTRSTVKNTRRVSPKINSPKRRSGAKNSRSPNDNDLNENQSPLKKQRTRKSPNTSRALFPDDMISQPMGAMALQDYRGSYDESIAQFFKCTDYDPVQTETLERIKGYSNLSSDMKIQVLIDLFKKKDSRELHALLLLAGLETSIRITTPNISSGNNESFENDGHDMTEINEKLDHIKKTTDKISDNLISAYKQVIEKIQKSKSDELLQQTKSAVSLKTAPRESTSGRFKTLRVDVIRKICDKCESQSSQALYEIFSGGSIVEVVEKYKKVL